MLFLVGFVLGWVNEGLASILGFSLSYWLLIVGLAGVTAGVSIRTMERGEYWEAGAGERLTLFPIVRYSHGHEKLLSFE